MPVRSAAASDPRRSPNAPAEMSRSATTRQTSRMSDDQSLSKPFPYDEPAAPKVRKYTLTPQLHRTTRAAEKAILKYLRVKARAAALFAEASEALQTAMRMTKGTGKRQQRVIEPGLVYEFSTPVTVDGKLRGTFQAVDNFAQPEVTKVCRVGRFEIKTWKGNGPGAETKAGAIAAAADVEKEELP